MDSSVIEIFPVSYDQDSEKGRETNKKCHKRFGEIVVGPRRVKFPKPYAEWADKIRNMKIRKDDVWIVSLPRSGTTWTEEMVWLLCNNLDYEAAKINSLHKRFMFLELAAMRNNEKLGKAFGTIDEVMNAESPRFIKTHISLELLPKELWTVKPKIIYVYRNPKDVSISFYHFDGMMKGYEETFEEWAEMFLQDKFEYTPFWTHVLDFWEFQKTHDVLFLTYEKMKENLLSIVYEVADYLGTKLTPEQAKKLTNHLDYDNMKHNAAVNLKKEFLELKLIDKPENVNFIRKGRSGQWKEVMTPEMIAKFDKWSEKYIKGTDFKFYE